jgi:eukaryotic-like serine/threonine-protein kinase
VGTNADQVTGALRALGLEVDRSSESSETVEAGLVLRVQPAGGNEVPRGSTVAIVVSSGPPLVTVPDVRGQSSAAAAQQLQGSGLTVSGTQGSPANNVTGTNPAAGQRVRPGTSVTIITG